MFNSDRQSSDGLFAACDGGVKEDPIAITEQ
jgi:hypothetical protein